MQAIVALTKISSKESRLFEKFTYKRRQIEENKRRQTQQKCYNIYILLFRGKETTVLASQSSADPTDIVRWRADG